MILKGPFQLKGFYDSMRVFTQQKPQATPKYAKSPTTNSSGIVPNIRIWCFFVFLVFFAHPFQKEAWNSIPSFLKKSHGNTTKLGVDGRQKFEVARGDIQNSL